MRARGYFTVEAAFVISSLVLIIAQIIKLDFYLHDCLVFNTTEIMSEIRYKNAQDYYYDSVNHKIKVSGIVSESVEGDNEDFLSSMETAINKVMKEYFSDAVLYNEVKFEEFDPENVDSSLFSHGDLVRLGESIKRLTGGL